MITIETLPNGLYRVTKNGNESIMTIDEVVLLLITPAYPVSKQTPTMEELEEFWTSEPAYEDNETDYTKDSVN